MDQFSFNNYDYDEKRTFLCVNDVQVIFNTDFKTYLKLQEDDVLLDYIQAVIRADLLRQNGIDSHTKIRSLDRLIGVDDSKCFVSLDISTTNQNDGVEELRCALSKRNSPSGNTNILSTSEESSDLWNFKDNNIKPERTTLRWTAEMTTLLIQIRGNMTNEFARTKHKFRLWEIVARRLNALVRNVNVTAKDCDDKWRNIAATYRKNIEKMKYSGDLTIRWEHFHSMDNILKGTLELRSAECNKIKSSSQEMEQKSSFTHNSQSSEIDIDIIDCAVDYDSVDYEIDPSKWSFVTQKSNYARRKWNIDLCLLLFSFAYEYRWKLRKPAIDNSHVWKEIAVKMNEKPEYGDFSENEVESVWKYCVKNYETNLGILKSQGVGRVKWQLFAIVDEILGGTNEISELCIPRPGEDLLNEFFKMIPNLEESGIYNLCSESESGTLDDVEIRDETDNDDSGTIWTLDMVKMLISLRKEMELEMHQNHIPKKRFWKEISKKIKDLKGMTISERDCDEKWRNLTRTYKKNLMRLTRNHSTVRWPHFWPMREILGNCVTGRMSPYSLTNGYESGKDVSFESITEAGNKRLETIVIEAKPLHNSEMKNDYSLNESPNNNNNNYIQFSTEPPNWFIEYVMQKESLDSKRYKKLMSMLNEIKDEQKRNRMMISSIIGDIP